MTPLDPEDARQGRKGTPVLRVLIAALVLCVIGAFGMGAYAWIMPDQSLPEASIGGGVGSNEAPPAGAAASNPAATAD